MTRSLDAATETALQAGAVSWALMAEFELSDLESVCVWTGVGELVYDGKTFLGVGDFGGVSKVSEHADGTLDAVSYTLSGVENEIIDTLISEMLDANIEGRAARLWLAAFDPDMAIIGAPVLLRNDLMNDLSTVDEAGQSLARLEASPPGVSRGVASPRVYSDLDQQAEYPGDDFFKNIETVGLVPIKLG